MTRVGFVVVSAFIAKRWRADEHGAVAITCTLRDRHDSLRIRQAV